MSNSIIINSSNVVGANKNTYQYNFINGNYKIKEGAEISISSITIPYSWFNVTTAYDNKQFQVSWTVGTTQTFYVVTLPDGFYSVTDINNYLQQYSISNGFYLINASGQNVYYWQIVYNANYYAVQILLFPVPSSMPTGYTAPINFAGFPTTTTTPQFLVPALNSIGDIIGFSPSTYGVGGSSSQSFLSNKTPQGSIVNSIVLRCSLVDNYVCSPPDIIDSIPITSTFGSNINYVPNFEKWIKLKPGSYSNLIISFYDQNLNLLNMQDTNILVTLLIKN